MTNIELLTSNSDMATKDLRKRRDFVKKYELFLEEAKTDLYVSEILDGYSEVGVKRRRLFFLEQTIEKAVKAAFPVFEQSEKLPKKLKDKLNEIMRSDNPPKKINHKLDLKIPDITNLLNNYKILNDTEKNNLVNAYSKQDILTLIDFSSKILLKNGSILQKMQNKVSCQQDNLYLKDSSDLYYIIVVLVWDILALYEQSSRYPDLDKNYTGVSILLNNLDKIHKYVVESISTLEKYTRMHKGIKFY